MRFLYPSYFLALLICFCGCSQFTYRPHSAKQKYFARPHMQFMMAVVDFREKYGVWPPSVSEIVIRVPTSKKIIEDFQYETANFVIKDNDHLTVYFSGYKKKSYYADETKIDLNAFHGRINFFKSQGKFVWKLKMA